MNLGDICYVPQFKWKAGERAAIGNFEPSWRRRILPLFRLVPPGGFEADLGVTLSSEEFLKNFGNQLADVVGRSPTLVDGELLDGVEFVGGNGQAFVQLLERARLAGANPIPVFRPQSSGDYVGSVGRYLKWSDSLAGCVRISLGELESLEGREDLRSIAGLVGSKSENCVLLVDAGPLSISDPEVLTHLLSYQFSRLIRENDWKLVVFSSTTFPKAPKIDRWASKSFARNDWLAFRNIVDNSADFPVIPVFSDYSLEYPANYVPKPISPSAHLRYSTENKYFIFKGASVRHFDKYANIFRVADQLTQSGIFKGRSYSQGDAYIQNLANDRTKTGHASKWRWCATDHHLTLVLKQLDALLDLELDQAKVQIEPDQLQLILS